MTAARAAVRRRALMSAAGLAVAAILGAAVLMDQVSFGLVDRYLFAALIAFGVAGFQASRMAVRIRRQGPDAAGPDPPPPGEAAARDPALDGVDRFLVAERFRLIGDRYELSILAADGRTAAEPVGRVDRAAFQARERLEAFAPDARLVFALKAERILDVGGKYQVTDYRAERIGELRKLFAESLVRSKWEVWDGAGALVATAQERSLRLALARRLIDILPVPIPYHFDLHAPDGEPIGSVLRLRTFRDRYVLDLSPDSGRTIDRRLGLALAVALDGLQDR